ncbi:methyl-accepting chemotaxis protein [Neptuniibacter caesariensis]|uniref:Methyl-accepting chemotaxis protein n=1 Tax=Neptuniibacter caesariensis TaxID=207954 RepID=A0A7U8C762_NEPCE|nr:methyl-accepting chemotaxis protein [Neptuniibacter caesariensis]EAR62822.1 methyl-accepting chemotaxis protein [Oceanospirillum sp. MED92] [Neptuniibacter caesariensis]
MLQVTFKQKLIFVVLLTLVSIAYLGFVSLSNLSEQNNSAKRVSNLTETSDLLSTLQLELLTAESALSQMTETNASAFDKELKTMSASFKQGLSEKSVLTTDPKLAEMLEQSSSFFTQYINALSAQLSAQRALGFNGESGVLKPLNEAAADLEDKLSVFSMLLQPFIVTRQLEKEYLISPSQEAADKLSKQLETVIYEVKDAEFYDTFGPSIETYQAQTQKLIVAAENRASSYLALNKARTTFKAHITNTQRYLKTELLSKARDQAEAATADTRWTIILVSVILALAISAILAKIGVSAGLTLKSIVQQVNKIASGDLTTSLKISENKADEFDQVSKAVNTMTDDLRQVIRQVAQSQSELQLQSEELSQAIQTIASNNSQVSDQSNHLASATEQISATTEQVAHRVQSLQTDSQNAHQAAVDGGTIISYAMTALSETARVVEASSMQLQQLQQHSEEIDKVLLIINDLADQTNLLALNAAIEAARAGEAGRGFSVVADEVRTLAESTVKATGDITDTVRAIQQQTRSVIDVMNQSTKSIDEVKQQGGEAQRAVERIEQQTQQALSTSTEITGAIDEVATTTREMASSMDQIAQGIEQNSCASNAIVTSADNLKGSAENMGEMTRKFSY